MSELPQHQRVRVMDGPHAGEIGILNVSYPSGFHAVDIGWDKVIMCRRIERLTADEEAELITEAKANDLQDAQVQRKRGRGRQPGSKNKPKTDSTRAPEERPAETTQPEAMTTVPTGDKPYHITDSTTPVLGHIEQLSASEPTRMNVVPPEMRAKEALTARAPSDREALDLPRISDSDQAVGPAATSPTPLLIIVEPDGTTVLSTPVTKDNVTDIIRSLIDLVA